MLARHAGGKHLDLYVRSELFRSKGLALASSTSRLNTEMFWVLAPVDRRFAVKTCWKAYALLFKDDFLIASSSMSDVTRTVRARFSSYPGYDGYPEFLGGQSIPARLRLGCGVAVAWRNLTQPAWIQNHKM